MTAVVVMEYQRNGTAHLHILVNRYVHQRQLANDWRRITGDSFVVDVRPVDAQRAAHYVAKYLSKALDSRQEHPKGRRRYSSTQGVFLSLRLRLTPEGNLYRPWVPKTTVSDWVLAEAKGEPEQLKTALDPSWEAFVISVCPRGSPGAGAEVVAYG